MICVTIPYVEYGFEANNYDPEKVFVTNVIFRSGEHCDGSEYSHPFPKEWKPSFYP